MTAFRHRREVVYTRLGDGVLVLPAAPIQYSSRDTERAYCPDRELYYVTGVTEPASVAVLVGREERFVLFVRDKDPEAELWSGPRLGPAEARDLHGADECYALSELETRLPELLSVSDHIHFRQGRGGPTDRLVSEAFERARVRGSRTGMGPRGILDPGGVIDALRVVKDDHELAVIRRACGISVRGQRAAAAAVASGVGEWAVEAAVEGAFRSAGATGPGFDTIVGSGDNACVLHYVDNRDLIADNALVLVDAGAEFGLYHGDITRTYPASGTFSTIQRDVYDIVEAAREAGIAAIRPGVDIAEVHATATRVLVGGLVDIRVLSGDIEDLIAEDAHTPFFPHQTSHWLGLDLHDPGEYVCDGSSTVLAPGMVFTVEPGLYFRLGLSEGAASAFTGIGVRIEDDVVVTATGCEILTAGLPTSASEIESIVGSPA